MIERIITGPDCVAEGALALVKSEPRFAVALEQVGTLPLRLRGEGFVALRDAIVGQQVSVASATAIRRKMTAAGLTGPRKLKAATDLDLRACGLSAAKMRYLRALAGSGIRYKDLRDRPSPEVIGILTEVPGIGRWTAEIYLMFSLGRADVFAAGDLALRESARMLFARPDRPSEAELRVMAEAWSPWRSVAARLLWAYYRIEKQREGI